MTLRKVKETIRKYKLLERGDKVLIAYSGGADSTALLSLLWELRKEWVLELFLAHFNHRLRQSAEEDEKFVRSVADEYSLHLFVGGEDVRSYARSKSLNLEEAGRELRYSFLEKTAEECDATKIATGHTMTDQAETFLMRLIRGTGAKGLGGIYPVVAGKIIRPLIQVEREEITAYLAKRKLDFRVDESNFDRRFLRNKVRLELIPYLQKKFEPRIIHHLSRLASILREEDSLLDKIGIEKAKKCFIQKDNQILLDMKFISSLPLALKRRVSRHYIHKLKGNLRGISFADVEAVLKLKEGKECHLKKGLVLRREGGFIFLKEESQPRIEYEQAWEEKDHLEIKELGLEFEGKKIEKSHSFPLKFDDENLAFLDWRKLQFPLLVRNRQEGDKYQPLGAPGKKKLKEIMRAKGIPLSEREKRPVFLSQNDIVWVQGLPVSERYKVKKNTDVIFMIERL
jgi:tRNA(Ile)-lysidine synthase